MDSYDPNEAVSLDTDHIIELTFQAWEATATRRVRIGGNCMGLVDAIESAIDQVVEGMNEVNRDDGYVGLELALHYPDGDVHYVDEIERSMEEELKRILVKAEIIELSDKEGD